MGLVISPKLRHDLTMKFETLCKSSTFKRGQSVVEFALVVPIFLFLIFGIIDFTRYYMTEQAMSHTLRSTARFASTGKTLDDPENPGQQLSRKNSIIKYTEDLFGVGSGDQKITDVTGVDGESSYDEATGEYISPYIKLDPEDGGSGGDFLTITFEQDFTFITPFITDNIFDGKIVSKIRVVNERF